MKIDKEYKSFGGQVQFCSHKSQTTNTPMAFSVFIPTKAKAKKVPVLFWLSGLTCTEENFMAKAGAQQWAEEEGLMLVSPDTSPRGTGIAGEHDHWDFGSGAGFYVNATTDLWKRNYQMYDYVVKEFPQVIAENFPADMNRCGISGHSMGGHGALVIGLRNSDQFKSISAFSPICAPTQCPWGEKAFSNYLGGNREEWKAYDASELIRSSEKQLPILVDQGSSDNFLEEQLKTPLLIEACQQSNYPAEIRMQEGYDHSYYFIASFIKEHIRFHKSCLSV